MAWLSEFGKFIQQTTKTWLGIFMASGLLWLSPEIAVVANSTDKINSYIGVAVHVLFVLSASMLVSDLAFYVRDVIRNRRKKNAKFEVFKRLTPPERALMRRFVEGETKSIGLDPRDPTVMLFIERRWISQPINYVGASVGRNVEPFLPPHVVEDWIYYFILDNKELIS